MWAKVEQGADLLDINMDDGLIEGVGAMTRFVNLLVADPETSRVPFMIDSSKARYPTLVARNDYQQHFSPSLQIPAIPRKSRLPVDWVHHVTYSGSLASGKLYVRYFIQEWCTKILVYSDCHGHASVL